MVHTTSVVKRKRRGMYFRCETCGKEFYAYPSDIKKAQKRGGMIRFCSVKCYDRTGDNNPMWGKKHKEESIRKMAEHPNRSRFLAGKDNPNFVRYGEEYGFEGKTRGWWQRKLLNEIGECEECGYSDKRALCIHHKDKNTKNNIRKNLELLCWNCHMIKHYKDKSGIYSNLREGNVSRTTRNYATK